MTVVQAIRGHELDCQCYKVQRSGIRVLLDVEAEHTSIPEDVVSHAIDRTAQPIIGCK